MKFSDGKLEEGFTKTMKVVKSEGIVFKLLRGYVRELCDTFEHNPTPGAQRSVEFCAPKETWKLRYEQCELYFKEKGKILVGGCQSSLRTAWKSCIAAVDRSMKCHAKCDKCSLHAALYCSLIGKTDARSNYQRGECQKAKIAHQTFCAGEREVLDDAGYRAILHPNSQWCLIADGATQRNFMFPKCLKRAPKCLAQKDLFCTKLYGVFAYG